MKLKFEYNKERDVWCLLNKGKSSNNSSFPTEVYKKLVAAVGDNPDEENTSVFIDQYISENNYDIKKYTEECQTDFDSIALDYEKIAEKIFNVSLNNEIAVFITVNNRCPYSVEESWFFVSISNKSARLTIMHELWHFYTWYAFGINFEEKIGKEKYNAIKEALTVLLNVECKNLLPENREDKGYPQHTELREGIVIWWNENHDINYVFEKAVKFLS